MGRHEYTHVDTAEYARLRNQDYEPDEARREATHPGEELAMPTILDGEGGCLGALSSIFLLFVFIPAGLAAALVCPPVGLLFIVAAVVWFRAHRDE